MLILRVKRAQVALADGRLDEAFELLADEAVRAHRRGQDLIARLTGALLDRARRALAEDRPADATADVDKAGCLSGNLPEVAALRSQAAAKWDAAQQAERRQARLVAAAQRCLEENRYSRGQALLAELPAGRAESLRRSFTDRHERMADCLASAEAALAQADWEGALDAIRPVLAAGHARVEAVRRAAAAIVRDRLSAAFVGGRLGDVLALADRLAQADPGALETHQWRQTLDELRGAYSLARSGLTREAADRLRLLVPLHPKATWLADVHSTLERATESLDQLRGGPMGWLAAVPPSPRPGPPAATQRLPAPHPASAPSTPASPAQVVLQVDGAGSYLLLTRDRVTLGPAGATPRPDVGLLIEPSLPALTFERIDEDYFVRSSATVHVNGRVCTRKLLASGDNVELGSRARFAFRLPHSASTSAVLELSGARLPSADVRRVVLVDREVLIGPGAACHVRVPTADEPLVLRVRDGRFYCQTGKAIYVDDRPAEPSTPLPLGRAVRVDDVHFVLAASAAPSEG